MNDTELSLRHWRNGATQAERLAAAVLSLAGFTDVDPQATLGGPDGGKDILCKKGGMYWVGAVYFPVDPVRFSTVRKKFAHDLEGLPKQCDGIAFVTNQKVTLAQRDSLTRIGQQAGKVVEIFHLERLRMLLDTPSGVGARSTFLGVQMTPEEQLSWFSESRKHDGLTVGAAELVFHLRTLITRPFVPGASRYNASPLRIGFAIGAGAVAGLDLAVERRQLKAVVGALRRILERLARQSTIGCAEPEWSSDFRNGYQRRSLRRSSRVPK